MIVRFLLGLFLVLSSLFLIVFILLHSGKGSGLSDMFGGASSLSGGTALEYVLVCWADVRPAAAHSRPATATRR